MSLTGEVRLGGRLFNIVHYEAITVLNEHYIMKLIRSTGLDRVLPLENAEESDEAYMMRVHAAVVDTLQLPQLLAGYLLPAGKGEEDWTLQMASETAAYIGKLSAPEDKSEIHRLGLLVTFDFFRAGIDSLRHSQNVSASLMRTIPNPSSESPSTAAH